MSSRREYDNKASNNDETKRIKLTSSNNTLVMNVEKPNFGLSGALSTDKRTSGLVRNGVQYKYAEPLEAKMPTQKYRLFPFKGETSLEPLFLHRKSFYIFGTDVVKADIILNDASDFECEKEHAVIQYRLVDTVKDGKVVKPYLIDLESKHGTFLNFKKIEPAKYVELLVDDIITFATSEVEYVLSKTEGDGKKT